MLLIIAILVLVFLVMRILFLVPVSFNGGSVIEWPPRGFSTKWYEMVLGSVTWLLAGLRSIYVGLSVAALAVILALPAAIALTRRRVAGQRLILVTMLAPMKIGRAHV